MEIIFETIIPCLLFIGIIIFFIVSLILFKRTPKDSEKYRSRTTAFIVSGTLAVVLIIVIVTSFIDAYIILEGIFFGIPVGIIIFFIVSLVMLRKTPKDSEKYRSRKTAFIISAVLTVIIVTAVVLFIMISIALTNM